MIRRARKSCRILLVAALLYGSGAHWLMVQGAAWAGMVATRAGRNSVAAAAVALSETSLRFRTPRPAAPAAQPPPRRLTFRRRTVV